MARRKSGLGYRRGGLRNTSSDYRRAVLRRKAAARKNCPLFSARVRDAIANYKPTDEVMQPVFNHQLKLAESAAAQGDCRRAYREVGDAKRFGRKHQRDDD